MCFSKAYNILGNSSNRCFDKSAKHFNLYLLAAARLAMDGKATAKAVIINVLAKDIKSRDGNLNQYF